MTTTSRAVCDNRISMYWKSRKANPPASKNGCPWYADPSTFTGHFMIEVIEFDEETGKEISHKIHQGAVSRGLTVMATKYGHLFKQITGDNIDAPCADIFLQCVVFGKEKYA